MRFEEFIEFIGFGLTKPLYRMQAKMMNCRFKPPTRHYISAARFSRSYVVPFYRLSLLSFLHFGNLYPLAEFNDRSPSEVLDLVASFCFKSVQISSMFHCIPQGYSYNADAFQDIPIRAGISPMIGNLCNTHLFQFCEIA